MHGMVVVCRTCGPVYNDMPAYTVARAREDRKAWVTQGNGFTRCMVCPAQLWRRVLVVIGSGRAFGAVSKRHDTFPICPIDLVDVLVDQLDLP
jgi:hypothetical protein